MRTRTRNKQDVTKEKATKDPGKRTMRTRTRNKQDVTKEKATKDPGKRTMRTRTRNKQDVTKEKATKDPGKRTTSITNPFEELSECYNELKEGYPSFDTLRRFPLGTVLQELDRLSWADSGRPIVLNADEVELSKTDLEQKLKRSGRLAQKENLGEIYHQHGMHVMSAIRYLTNSDLPRIVHRLEGRYHDEDPYKPYLAELSKFCLDAELKQFLVFAAFYHDIGKAIHRDRHGILGRHLLESLDTPETGRFERILSLGENAPLKGAFSLLVELVGHHDLFGILCTGEAAFPVLFDALRMGDAKKALLCLVTMNLADVYGTFQGKMEKSICKTYLADWVRLNNYLREDRGIAVFKSDTEKNILSYSQEREQVVERLTRMLRSAITDKRCKFTEESHRADLVQRLSSDVVLSALQKRLGPELPIFCFDSALVCRYDYALRFIIAIVQAWTEDRVANHHGELDVRDLAAILVEVFARLVSNYRQLTELRGNLTRRVGIELMGVTRSRKISETIVKLLLGLNRPEGVNWIADEATAWYFV